MTTFTSFDNFDSDNHCYLTIDCDTGRYFSFALLGEANSKTYPEKLSSLKKLPGVKKLSCYKDLTNVPGTICLEQVERGCES